jgi:uncharacterized protein (DUF2147 family)
MKRPVIALPALWVALCAALGAAWGAAPAARASTGGVSGITGLWEIQNGTAVVDIQPCGPQMCGRIVAFEIDHPANPSPRDWLGNTQCGLTLLQGSLAADRTAYEGWITDPRNGRAFHVRFNVDADGKLALRGYVLVPLLGATQYWTRYQARPPADCRIIGINGKLPPTG